MPEHDVVFIGTSPPPLLVFLLGALALLLMWTLASLLRVGRGGADRKPMARPALLIAAVLLPATAVACYRWPWPFQRWAMRSSLAHGEQVFARYLAHFEAHQRYPAIADALDEADRDHFDKVAGLTTSPHCNPYGTGCRALQITVRPTVRDSLEVHVYQGRFECTLTTMRQGWQCRDHL